MIKTEIIEALVPLKDPALIAMLAHLAEIHHYKKGSIFMMSVICRKRFIFFGAVF